MTSNSNDRKSKTKLKWLSCLLVVSLLSLGGALSLWVLTDLRLNSFSIKDKYAEGYINAALGESLDSYRKMRPFRMGAFLNKPFFAKTEDSVVAALQTSINDEFQEVGSFVDTTTSSRSVSNVVFSPDGQTILASGSVDRTIKLWSRDGKLLNTLKGHDADVMGLVPQAGELVTYS